MKATKAVAKKAQKKISEASVTDAMLYQMSYEALLEAGDEWVQFIPVIWREWNDVRISSEFSLQLL